MPLRRKSFNKKNNSTSDIMSNGQIKQRPDTIQKIDSSSSTHEKRRGSTKSAGSLTPSENESSLSGGERSKREGSSSSIGIARTRRGSRDCVIPENIDVSDKLHISETNSPMFMIQDCSYDSPKTRPIMLRRLQSEEKDCISIRELSESPQRFGMFHNGRKDDLPMSRLSSHESVDGEPMIFHPPSSPLLVAMRTAVDSLNQYEDFEILEEIGAGFFAQVFKVRHKPTGELMVLKRNKRKTVSLLKEVELLKRLQHANILHYVGACIHEGHLHPLTEYISGGTLEELIQSKEEFPWATRLHLSLDVSRGMGYLHDHGMFHRDLNSRNVLLRRNAHKYTAVVADFGLAAKTIPSTLRNKLTRSQSIVGTPYWMAPEVLNGKPYNETADVFSYGIVLCEVITRLSADPDDIPRLKNYSLNEEEFQRLPEVSQGSCPHELLEVTFLCCKVLPIERPTFNDITTRLYVIRDLHSLELVHQEESVEDTDTIIEPQPPIRLSYNVHHQSGSLSPASIGLQSAEFTGTPQPIQARISRETSV